jgi:SAM-dependent methyltransferase
MRFLKEDGRSLIGIDVNPEALAFASKEGETHLCDAEDLSMFYECVPFDTVVLMEILEHVRNPWNCLHGVYRILKENGVLIISTPNGAGMVNIKKGIGALNRRHFENILSLMEKEEWGSGDQRDHIYSWDIYTLYRLLFRCGFKYETHRFLRSWPLRNIIMLKVRKKQSIR